jgi:C-terminal processing protease CtpA/Prc
MTVRSLTILKVYEGLTADKVGIMVNDQVIEIDGISVADSLMDTLETAMDKPVGDCVTFIIKRPDGSKQKISVKFTTRNWE